MDEWYDISLISFLIRIKRNIHTSTYQHKVITVKSISSPRHHHKRNSQYIRLQGKKMISYYLLNLNGNLNFSSSKLTVETGRKSIGSRRRRYCTRWNDDFTQTERLTSRFDIKLNPFQLWASQARTSDSMKRIGIFFPSTLKSCYYHRFTSNDDKMMSLYNLVIDFFLMNENLISIIPFVYRCLDVTL